MSLLETKPQCGGQAKLHWWVGEVAGYERLNGSIVAQQQDKETCVLKKFSSDSTIAPVWSHLTHQRDYVAGALNQARLCKNKHGNAFVKIGVTGTGQKPCYHVFLKTEEGGEEIFGSYWDMHQPLDNEHTVSENWSTAAMTYEEFYVLMMEQHPPRSMPP